MRPYLLSGAVALVVGALSVMPTAHAATASASMRTIVTIAGNCLIDTAALRRNPHDPDALSCTAATRPLISQTHELREQQSVEVVTVAF